MQNQSFSSKFLQTVLLAFALACVFTLALSALGAALVMGGVIPQQKISAAASAVNVLSVFLGCVLVIRRSAGQKLLCALAAGGCYTVICAAVRLLFLGAEPGRAVPFLICTAAAALLAGLVSCRQKPRSARRRR